MLQLTLSRQTDREGSVEVDNSASTVILIIKGRGFDVEQFEAGVRRRFEKLNEQMFGQDVVNGGEEGVRLEHLYETISVMSGAFVEGTRGGNVSFGGVVLGGGMTRMGRWADTLGFSPCVPDQDQPF